MKIKKPRGTRDFPPRKMWERDCVGGAIEKVFLRYGYRKVLVPTFEHVELFSLKSGQEIEKHMYVFRDKSKREICLRPEATASICRMFAEELRGMKKPVKVYYYCPMFRYERPQRGRYREFWQMGVELIGPDSPQSDAEVISVAVESLKKLGLEFELEIGHIGVMRGIFKSLDLSETTQKKLIAALDEDPEGIWEIIPGPGNKKSIIGELINLKGDGKTQILDKARELVKDCPTSLSAVDELADILGWLDEVEINYKINLGITRGLEYYTGMVFEIRVNDLGAQNQICGGGRYDSLIELFSGVNVPAVGFSFGFDRVMESVHAQKVEAVPRRRMDVVVAPTSIDMKKKALKIASEIRGKYDVDLDLMNRKLRKLLEYADEINARFVVIVGQRDLDDGKITVRDMDTGEQEKIDVRKVCDFLDRKLS